MLNRDSNGHVIRLSRDLTDHVTCVVTRLGPDGVLLGDPPVQGPLPPRSARPAAPEPTPPPQVRATRGVVWDIAHHMGGGGGFTGSCPRAGAVVTPAGRRWGRNPSPSRAAIL